MDCVRNDFGDMKIIYDEKKSFPEIVENHHTILVGANLSFYNERVPFFIGHTQTHGYLFGNKHANESFPYLSNSLALGGCVVAFANIKPRFHSLKTYALLVKIKNRNYLMNPAGYMQKTDGSLREAAMREFAEETGCELMDWKPCAEWQFKTKFAGLDLIGHTTAGFGFIRHFADNHWIDAFADESPVVSIPVENDETERVIFIDVMQLNRLQEFEEHKLLPCKLSGHHLNMIVREALKRDLVPQIFANLCTGVDYLSMFQTL